MFDFLGNLFRYGFWVLMLGGFLAIASFVWEYMDFFYVNKTIGGYMATQKYMFVRIFPPASNKSSIQEMETFLIALNATYAPKDAIDYYITGSWHDTFTFELHAKDKKIGIYCRLNASKLSLFRSSLESRFPGLRIVESPDPMEELPENWDSKGFGEYKAIRGSEMVTAGGEKLLHAEAFEGNDIYPLKSWREFQRDDMTITADPIVQLYTSLQSNSENNYIIIQFVTTPFSQDDQGAKVKDRWRKEFTVLKEKYAADSKSLVSAPKPGEITPQATAPLLSEQERKQLDAMGRKIASQIFKVKIRLTVFSKVGDGADVFQEIMSFFEQYGTDTIKFAPRKFCRTWEKDKGNDFGVLGPWIAQVTNQIYWKIQSTFQTNYYYRGFKTRSTSMVTEGKYFTVEELAGLFHFPVTSGEDAAKDQLAEMLSIGYGDSEDVTIGAAAPINLPQ
jgi:hypothetical protein